MSRWNRYEKLIQQGKLPSLRIVSLDNIVLHERVEGERAGKLRARIEMSGILQNPIICCPLPESEKYLLLDGAHRFTALQALGCNYAPVQVVDYDDPLLELKKWRHLFVVDSGETVERTVDSIDGVTVEREPAMVDPFRRITPRFYAQIIFRAGNSILITGKNDINGKVGTINALSSMYMPAGLIDRISYDDLESLRTHYDRFTGLIVYPQFTKEDIVAIAQNHLRLPAGITRHIIPKRALHLNLPLSTLRFTDDRKEVENFLMDFIEQKIKNSAIRFYTESTFFFDD